MKENDHETKTKAKVQKKTKKVDFNNFNLERDLVVNIFADFAHGNGNGNGNDTFQTKKVQSSEMKSSTNSQ